MDNVTNLKAHSLQCDSRKKTLLTGVKEVLSANDTVVLVDTSSGLLEITGAELKIQKYNADEGGLVITGEFNAFKYDQSRERGFLKRLFK
ncbi:MAG TPA: YabP/YqfC family sporulation protein [Clostridia bacterium]